MHALNIAVGEVLVDREHRHRIPTFGVDGRCGADIFFSDDLARRQIHRRRALIAEGSLGQLDAPGRPKVADCVRQPPHVLVHRLERVDHDRPSC